MFGVGIGCGDGNIFWFSGRESGSVLCLWI